jgi:hypothetical protein
MTRGMTNSRRPMNRIEFAEASAMHDWFKVGVGMTEGMSKAFVRHGGSGTVVADASSVQVARPGRGAMSQHCD